MDRADPEGVPTPNPEFIRTAALVTIVRAQTRAEAILNDAPQAMVAPSTEDAEIRVTITHVIDREFKRRGVFTELRVENAARVNTSSGMGTHKITPERARQLLADAEVERRNSAHQGGTKNAYTALARHIRSALRWAQDSAPTPVETRSARPESGGGGDETPDEQYNPSISDDDDWPPHVRHNPAIAVGDGSKWHYLAHRDVLVSEGILDADQCPGNPACKTKWYSWGWNEGILFIATRIGNRVAVTLLGVDSIDRCPPLKFNVR